MAQAAYQTANAITMYCYNVHLVCAVAIQLITSTAHIVVCTCSCLKANKTICLFFVKLLCSHMDHYALQTVNATAIQA